MASVFSDIDSFVIFNPDSLDNKKSYTKELIETTQEMKLINTRFYNITREHYKITFPDGRVTYTVDEIQKRIG